MKKTLESKVESLKSKFNGETTHTSLKLVIYGVIGVVFVILSSLVVYFYFQYTNAKMQLKSASTAEKNAANALVTQVAKLIELPKETASIATVSDKKKLQNQPFFLRAENGDKVLIYSGAKKAILYRPSTNKIIEVGPINVSEAVAPTKNTPTPEAQTTAAPSMVKIALYNGSTTAGLAGSAEKVLTEKFKNIEVVQKSDTKGNYSANKIVDLTGKNSEIVQQITTLLGGEVALLPIGETKPEADILVILGK